MTPADDHLTAHHNLQTLISYLHGELPTEQAAAIAAEAKSSRSLQLRLDLIRTLLCTDLEDLESEFGAGDTMESAPEFGTQCPEPLALARYGAAELDLVDSAMIQHHLTQCESCRRTTLHLDRIAEQLTQLEQHARAAAAARARSSARAHLSEKARQKVAQIRADIEAAPPPRERSTLLRLCGDVAYLPYSPTRGRGALGLGLAEASELSARIDVAREELVAEERERREREQLPVEPSPLLPGDVEHLTGRALLLRSSQDRVRRAVAALELATTSPTTTDCAGAWNDLGVARFTAGDLEGALEAIGEALDLDPVRREILYNRGRLLSVIGLRHLAERDLQCFLSQVREMPGEADWAREAIEELEALFPPSQS